MKYFKCVYKVRSVLWTTFQKLFGLWTKLHTRHLGVYTVHAYTMPSSTEIQFKLRLYLWSDAGLYLNQYIYMLNQRMPYNAHKTGLVKKMINKFDILLNVTDQPFKIQINMKLERWHTDHSHSNAHIDQSTWKKK